MFIQINLANQEVATKAATLINKQFVETIKDKVTQLAKATATTLQAINPTSGKVESTPVLSIEVTSEYISKNVQIFTKGVVAALSIK